MQCAKCNDGRLIRAKRKGFLEKNIYSIFGYYPWRCKTCKYRLRLRLRYDYLPMDSDPNLRPAPALKRNS